MEWKCGESWSDVGRINFGKMGDVDSSGSLILSEGNCHRGSMTVKCSEKLVGDEVEAKCWGRQRVCQAKKRFL